MNTFLNVVFRKILYKIPLKFLLLLLCVGAVLFASVKADYFSSYGNYIDNEWKISTNDTNLNNTTYTTLYNYNNGTYTGAGTYCLKVISSNPIQMSVGFSNSQNSAPNNLYTIYNDQYNTWICLYGNKPYFNAKLNSSSNTVHLELFKLDDFINSSYECSVEDQDIGLKIEGYTNYILYHLDDINLSTYQNIVNVSANIDSNYCENNNLCPVYTGECENLSGVNWSSLYINNIQHVGGPNIYISIPEEIGWDYFYYNDNFNLSISGSVYDYEKLDQLKSVQSYIPTTDDFSHIIGGFGPFGALLVGVLFIIFVFYMIKKIF